MKSVAFTEYLVKGIVKNKDLVTVKGLDDEDFVTIQVLVSSDDMAMVIGKGGNTINSIRTLVQTVALVNNEKKVKINVDTF